MRVGSLYFRVHFLYVYLYLILYIGEIIHVSKISDYLVLTNLSISNAIGYWTN